MPTAHTALTSAAELAPVVERDFLAGTGNPFNVTVYIPCHYDFSQIEHVAPFFDRFGGKIFIYRWHALYGKMKSYYEEAYKGAARPVTVHPLTPRDLVSHLLAEKQRKVVFILTASMAYPFGEFQRTMFTGLQRRFPDRVAAVNVVGHCMYGCMSCKGSQFKVPMYFSRFFSGRLPYSAADVRSWYASADRCAVMRGGAQLRPDAKLVLVAASTGETSILVQRAILEHMHALQHGERTHRFVWKLHPSNYNPGDYDLGYAPHVEELTNLSYIREHFEVTDEWKPSLLPFLSVFDVLLCDLHSTVAFMASYFAPKTILAWHNDADYEAVRDPAFVKNLNVFSSLDELRPLLAELPAPKGDKKFFVDMYGEPDGLEELKFGLLAGWPREADKTSAAIDESYDLRASIAEVTLEWDGIVRECIATKGGNDRSTNEDLDDAKTAVGLPVTFDYKLSEQARPSEPPAPAPQGLSARAKVLSMNLWYGGEGAGVDAAGVADALRASGATIIGLQETSGKADPAELARLGGNYMACTREDKTDAVARHLGPRWASLKQGYPLPHAYCMNLTSLLVDTAVWEVVAELPSRWGLLLRSRAEPAKSVAVVNTHMPYFPYEPYAAVGIPYDGQPAVANAAEAEASAARSRVGHARAIRGVLAECGKGLAAPPLLVVTGDFNEPSCLDWTQLNTLAGYAPFPCAWPATAELLGEADGSAGTASKDLRLRDAFRVAHADALREPGFTWSTRTAETDAADHWDRIDYVLVGGDAPHAVAACDVYRADALSDHHGVLADICF